MNKSLTSYYHLRAKEYDRVYEHPAEQPDLQTAATLFKQLFAGKHVLEIACGTGYWTEQISGTARSVHATDINESMIEIAKKRGALKNVTFTATDMYQLSAGQPYDGLFGGFIWSHILLQHLDRFLDTMKTLVKPGGVIVFADSNPVPGTKHDLREISHTDAQGNTYQTRMLDDGTDHEVLKNFPAQDFLIEKLSRIGADIAYLELEYYWVVHCKRM
jgi:2-polyprenyl-3-methyl-5-hydroxy-6-metoxy-1,4-benzoquinol methylase